jgi:phospholipase C
MRFATALLAVVGLVVSAQTVPAFAATAQAATATPIKHLVVIFDENVSFDHYFGTYPNAANTDGTSFTPAAGTPTVDNLLSAGLATNNPNLYPPRRLTPAQAVTCDQNHGYTAEQLAVNGGKMDQFVQNTSTDYCTGQYASPGLAMDYYDGNTVTALWNYAQNYAMSDNNWDTVFGPSSPGHLNLVSGQTGGASAYDPKTDAPKKSGIITAPNKSGVGTLTVDADPVYDDCSDNDHTSGSPVVGMSGKNIGDLLNAKKVTWGWFQGGFAPTTKWNGSSNGHASCDSTSTNVVDQASKDYSPHHNPFQYYKSTANPHHLAPTSVANVGKTDRANHQYDLSLFSKVLSDGNLPAVSFLKAPQAQDGHASSSDPLDEQKFLVKQINAIERSPQWSSTAVVVTYDDSDGWYDHLAPKILNGSSGKLTDTAMCKGVKAAGGVSGRCGPSQRLPLLVISPFARTNFVDHTMIEQTSVLKFIENNWKTGRIGGTSFDARAGSLLGMFDFNQPPGRTLVLNPDGSVDSSSGG